jgi:16S rRNA (uracil1498-N3)-methyltransferase
MERIRRVHHPEVPGPGALVVLDPEETHHVVRVLRLRAGDPVSVFDGRGREWEGVLLSASRSGATVRTGSELTGRVDPPLSVALFQALCRPERMEWVIQKGTEVGLEAVRPFAARRSEVEPPSEGRLARYRRVALEAARQCGRRRVPSVEDPVGTLPEVPEGTCALCLDAGPGAEAISERLRGPAPGAVWLAVGPEGGFEPDETQSFEASGWRRAGLGPRTLRTETAGAIAAALVLHAWGDLGRCAARVEAPRGVSL